MDREARSEYTLLIEAKDLGTPVQQATRTLQVVVKDIDDHPPLFNRQRNSVPLTMEVTEEIPVGIRIGEVAAVDLDQGINAEIDYAIINGNDAGIFDIQRDDKNVGVLMLRERLDRERAGLYTLTIRCFKPVDRHVKSQKKPYDRTKLDELQVRVVVLDKDDNNPRFLESNLTIGVRVNAPIYTELTKVTAVDPDPDAFPIVYSVESVVFHKHSSADEQDLGSAPFLVDPATGVIATNQSYGPFSDGYFDLIVRASNTPDPDKSDIANIKIFVLQDTDLMKFVFDEDPVKVSTKLGQFKQEVEATLALALPLTLNIYDTEFYSQVDGSLDFGRTSSCFQVMSDRDVIDLNSVATLFRPETSSPELTSLLTKYNVVSVERCSLNRSNYRVSWVEVCILIIAVFIGVAAFLAITITCCLHDRYKRLIRRSNIKIVEAPVRALIPASLPPGSIMGQTPPSVAGSNGRIYEWQETALPIDAQSFRSLPR